MDVEVFKHREVSRENDVELLKSVVHPQLNLWRFRESAGSRDENAYMRVLGWTQESIDRSSVQV